MRQVPSALAVGLAALLLIGPAFAGVRGTAGPSPPCRDAELLVRFTTVLSEAEVLSLLGADRVLDVRRFRSLRRPDAPVNRLYLLGLRESWPLEAALEELQGRDDVELAQPNYLQRKEEAPNDPYFYLQWGLENSGEVGLRGPLPGLPEADIRAIEAWDRIATLPPPSGPVVVGVVDTGIDYDHPDLASMIWTNPGEVADNGIDDDSNGYADDVHGWDFAYDDPDPMDEESHGTHVAGTAAAETNNGEGIAGTAGSVDRLRVMALKFLDDSGVGYTADAIEAIEYAIDNGARVLSNSWGGGPYEPALEAAIQDAHLAGVVFVASAGNDANDADQTAHYPSGYDVPNVVSVAASNRLDSLADFSNWGAGSVDLAAPGEEIFSTIPYLSGAYAYGGGTSTAVPQVSGVLALVYSLNLPPSLPPPERTEAAILLLLERTDPRPAFAGRLRSSGRLDLLNLVEPDAVPPDPVLDVTPVNAGSGFVTLRLTASGDDGVTGRANRYDARYAPADLWESFDQAQPFNGGWRPVRAGQFDYLSLSGLAPDTDYTFQVRVLDNAGNGSLSNLAAAATLPLDAAFSDDMESDTGLWSAQPTWERTTELAHSGSYAWSDSPYGSYANDRDSSLTSPWIDLSAAGSATLAFWHRFDLEQGADFGYVEVSADGIAWTPLLGVTGLQAEWRSESVDLTAWAGGAVQLRFRIRTDATAVRDGWYVDDVTVSTEPPGTDVLFEDPFDTADAWDLTWGAAWGIEDGRLSDSPGAVYANGLLAEARLAAPIDASASSRLYLSFDLEHEIEESYDWLYLEASTDGELWAPIQRWTGAAPAHHAAFDLSRFAAVPTLWLRFLLSTDPVYAYDGAKIDNLRLEAVPMPDGDGDGVQDPFDCAPGDGSAFAPPGEIGNVAFHPDKSTLSWDDEAPDCGSGVVYDVARGDLSQLPVGSGPAESCLDPGTPDLQAADAESPAPGHGYYYVVRGVNVCATGTYGYASSGDERVSAACP